MSESAPKSSESGVVESEISALEKEVLDLINVDDSGMGSVSDLEDEEIALADEYLKENEESVPTGMDAKEGSKEASEEQHFTREDLASLHARHSTAESLRGFQDAAEDATLGVSSIQYAYWTR